MEPNTSKINMNTTATVKNGLHLVVPFRLILDLPLWIILMFRLCPVPKSRLLLCRFNVISVDSRSFLVSFGNWNIMIYIIWFCSSNCFTFNIKNFGQIDFWFLRFNRSLLVNVSIHEKVDWRAVLITQPFCISFMVFLHFTWWDASLKEYWISLT